MLTHPHTPIRPQSLRELTRLTSLRCLSIAGKLTPDTSGPGRLWHVSWWQIPPRLTSLGLTGVDLCEQAAPSEDKAARCGALLGLQVVHRPSQHWLRDPYTLRCPKGMTET
jgi:hypothetical protein